MELTGVDLNLLVAFDALTEERSVTRAASRLSRAGTRRFPPAAHRRHPGP